MEDTTEIRKRRVALGVSQEELAKAAGVSYRTIMRLEKGYKIRERSYQKIMKGIKALEASGRKPSGWWKWHHSRGNF